MKLRNLRTRSGDLLLHNQVRSDLSDVPKGQISLFCICRDAINRRLGISAKPHHPAFKRRKILCLYKIQYSSHAFIDLGRLRRLKPATLCITISKGLT